MAARQHPTVGAFGFEVALDSLGTPADLALEVPVPADWTDVLNAFAYEYDQAAPADVVRERCFMMLRQALSPREALAVFRERFPAWHGLATLAAMPAMSAVARIEHLGFSLDAPAAGLRVCVQGADWPAIAAGVQAEGAGLDAAVSAVAGLPAIGELAQWGELRFLNLDLAQGKLCPQLGVECHLPLEQAPLQDLLHRLHALRLCHADAIPALLAWQASRAVSAREMLLYVVTHVKVQYGPRPRAKAYLACLPVGRVGRLKTPDAPIAPIRDQKSADLPAV